MSRSITRAEFEASPKILLRRKCIGTGPMDMHSEDTYQLSDGRFVLHSWGMGGEDLRVVRNAYTKQEQR